MGGIIGVPTGDDVGDPVIGIFNPPPQTQHDSFAVYPSFSKKLPQSVHLNPAEACQSQSLPLEFSLKQQRLDSIAFCFVSVSSQHVTFYNAMNSRTHARTIQAIIHFSLTNLDDQSKEALGLELLSGTK